MRFTLQKNNWYACELIGDEFNEDKCSYSPIRVYKIKPLGSGQRKFILSFYHANYPEGVNDKKYKLRTIQRGKAFILAKSIGHNPPRYLQIYDIDEGWLKRHFNIKLNGVDYKEWLDRNAYM